MIDGFPRGETNLETIPPAFLSAVENPKGFPPAGHEAPGKSQMLGFFSRVPDALAASGSCRLNGVKTTDEGIPYYCSLYDSSVISVADAFRNRDMSRGSGLRCLVPAFPFAA